MGLDMYLERIPRYGNIIPSEVGRLDIYFDWKRAKQDPKSSAKKHTLKSWCGVDYKDVPTGKAREFYATKYKVNEYGYYSIFEEVGYWRKANHIHNWFVENIQDGIDDCHYHREVTKEDLEELFDVCHEVLCSCEMADEKIVVGTQYENGERIPIMEDGQTVKDPTVAERLLPCVPGFFFGSTEYDNYYVESIRDTMDIITKVLETTDFEKEMICYLSSW